MPLTLIIAFFVAHICTLTADEEKEHQRLKPISVGVIPENTFVKRQVND